MTAEIRTKAGLGNPPDMYRQQANESINRVIKRDLERCITISECVDHIKSLVEQQQQEVILSMIGRGEYEIKPEYKMDPATGAVLTYNEIDFYRKTEAQRSHCIDKFNRVELKPRSSLSAPNFIPSLSKCSSTSAQIGENSSLKKKNSLLDAKYTNIINIPMHVLEPMFRKAERLIQESCAISLKPATGIQYDVKSYSRPNLPHTVQVKGSNILCDNMCESYRGFNMCSHTIAISVHIGKLDEYIIFYKSNFTTKNNLSNMSNVGMPMSRGKKLTKSTSKRKYGPKVPPKSKKPLLELVSTLPSPADMSTPNSENHQATTSNITEMSGTPVLSKAIKSPRQLISPISKDILDGIYRNLIIIEQPSVPIGRTMNPLPPLPEPQDQPYELLRRRGNISVCNGCRDKFDKSANDFILGRNEFERP